MVRVDSWQDDEEKLLAEKVLHNIRNGKTQLEAFDEISLIITRTPSACAYRWNQHLRKAHMTEVKEAKRERIQNIHHRKKV